MKITPLVAAAVAVVTLGACSAAPVGLESATAPSLELSNTTLSATTTFVIGSDGTAVVQPTAPATCTTSTSSTTTSTSTTQLSASGTYAVAYGSTLLPTCPTAP